MLLGRNQAQESTVVFGTYHLTDDHGPIHSCTKEHSQEEMTKLEKVLENTLDVSDHLSND